LDAINFISCILYILYYIFYTRLLTIHDNIVIYSGMYFLTLSRTILYIRNLREYSLMMVTCISLNMLQ